MLAVVEASDCIISIFRITIRSRRRRRTLHRTIACRIVAAAALSVAVAASAAVAAPLLLAEVVVAFPIARMVGALVEAVALLLTTAGLDRGALLPPLQSGTRWPSFATAGRKC